MMGCRFKSLFAAAAVCAAAGVVNARPPVPPDDIADSTLWQRFERMQNESPPPAAGSGLYFFGELNPADFNIRRHNDRSYILLPPMPQHVYVTGPYRLAPRWSLTISNGNAANWGVWPGAYLDARTLSFPAPR